jgi:rubrerythrin
VTLEEAIKTAIEYETRVWTLYADAIRSATDTTGKRVFGVLASEEHYHLGYLKTRLDEWEKTGKIKLETLRTTIPSREAISREYEQLKGHITRSARNSELNMLQRARDVETETSEFYKRMVSELGGDGQQMFAEFVKIEEGHLALVQAEIDAVSGIGFWFDMPEFDLEAE